MFGLSLFQHRMAGMGRVVGTLAIALYIGVVVLDLLPNSAPRDRLFKPLFKYVAALGLYQTYAVFTPHVPMHNTVLTAVVTFKDGNTAIWMFPRMEKLSLIERVLHERYRKWWHDNVIPDANIPLRYDAARFVARQFADQANPPVLVSLQTHSQPIPPPPPGMDSHRHNAEPEQKTICVYQVVPEDLK